MSLNRTRATAGKNINKYLDGGVCVCVCVLRGGAVAENHQQSAPFQGCLLVFLIGFCYHETVYH